MKKKSVITYHFLVLTMQTVCLFAPSDIFIILSVIYITTLDSHPDLPWRNVLVAKPIKEGSFLLCIQSGGAFEI